MTEDQNQRQLQQTLQQIEGMCGRVPEPFKACAINPAFLQDLYINFKKFVWNDGYLVPATKSAIALAVSMYLRSELWSLFFADRSRMLGLAVPEVDEIAAVVATCSAFNTYYTFTELAGEPFREVPGLRGHSLQPNHLDRGLAELIAIAVSTLNGCGACVRGHIKEARTHQVTDDQIKEAIQCAATVRAGCTFVA